MSLFIQNQGKRVPAQLRAHVFKPGQIANPGGRPKGSGTFAGELAAILGEEVEDFGTGKKSTRRRVAAERMADLLSAGDLQAWAVVLRYCPEVVSAQVIEQASGLCVTCGTACRRCHPPQPGHAEAKREQLTAMVQILLDTGAVRCQRCDPQPDS